MGMQNNGPDITRQIGETVAQYELLKQDTDGRLILTTGVMDADTGPLYVAQEAGVEDEEILVRTLNGVASAKILTTGAVTKGAAVYTGAGGITTTTTSGSRVGTAHEAGSTADVVETDIQIEHNVLGS